MKVSRKEGSKECGQDGRKGRRKERREVKLRIK